MAWRRESVMSLAQILPPLRNKWTPAPAVVVQQFKYLDRRKFVSVGDYNWYVREKIKLTLRLNRVLITASQRLSSSWWFWTCHMFQFLWSPPAGSSSTVASQALSVISRSDRHWLTSRWVTAHGQGLRYKPTWRHVRRSEVTVSATR